MALRNFIQNRDIIKFVDLFAGIGGIRKGLELALDSVGKPYKCVFTSEIKPHAIKVLKQNHPDEKITGDITAVDPKDIEDFDILCAGFPCQAFSSAGVRKGFADTRGTLFFNVENILKVKRPCGFILENVEGLINHDKGHTFTTILHHLKALGYNVAHRVLDASEFGVPQARKRIYIVGCLEGNVVLDNFDYSHSVLEDILEEGISNKKSKFISKLLSQYTTDQLEGKSIKDKRGGANNIHSWDIGVKGKVSQEEKDLLNLMLTKRRMHKWAEEWGIDWMDGMPLTYNMIRTFYDGKNLQKHLDRLTEKGYLKFEHPKKKIIKKNENGVPYETRVYDYTKEKGYNIVSGKLSFEISEILDRQGVAPTLVATDMEKLYVTNGNGLRNLTLREGLRLFGYPEDYKFEIDTKDGYDLLGNTVVVPVIKAVALKLITI